MTRPLLCTVPHSYAAPVEWRCRAVSSRRLVPGDVLVLLRGKATCDMVLLRGNCLVEESMLSGEVLTPPDWRLDLLTPVMQSGMQSGKPSATSGMGQFRVHTEGRGLKSHV